MPRPKPAGVRHNPEKHRFELDTPAGLAVADYRLSGGVMTIYHTEVPVPMRGRTFLDIDWSQVHWKRFGGSA